jgi:hypothetical protein
MQNIWYTWVVGGTRVQDEYGPFTSLSSFQNLILWPKRSSQKACISNLSLVAVVVEWLRDNSQSVRLTGIKVKV